eukprot:CAMPEP_0175136368 /NCGR_PEP_ID=MMETSP0087-20121206/9238_1 /TAXON_ID=136419 /ORGANISM="Unknown Unknown, Strain D1" /LENGTH=471 /DNA_ID=CAMNT_0016419119 /DNA_START=36 /DNA_END=1451 /DNA_ORIENTATION=+
MVGARTFISVLGIGLCAGAKISWNVYNDSKCSSLVQRVSFNSELLCNVSACNSGNIICDSTYSNFACSESSVTFEQYGGFQKCGTSESNVTVSTTCTRAQDGFYTKLDDNFVPNCTPPVDSTGKGYIAAVVAILGFGSNFIPVKKYEQYTGDGMFFQWVMCTGIWMSGLVVQIIRGSSSQFEPFAMLGGVLWCMGNLLCVAIIQCIGMGLGLLIWGGANLSIGWLSGAAGILGKDKESVENPTLNYLGAATALFSLAIFFFVKTNDKEQKDFDDTESFEYQQLPGASRSHLQLPNQPWTNKLTKAQRKLAGFVLAIVAGMMFGVNFNPPFVLIQQGKADQAAGRPLSHSVDSIDYVFSHFCGIYMFSTLAVMLYCAVKKNMPSAHPQLILPGFVCGVGWAIAQIAWFIANGILPFVISFPVVTTGPGLVASMWGVFLFKEIQGKRNFLVLGGAFLTTVAGVSMIAASKGNA